MIKESLGQDKDGNKLKNLYYLISNIKLWYIWNVLYIDRK